LLPAAIAATALWQAYIVDFYREASPILAACRIDSGR